jgi:hypothetical protein
MHTTEYFKFERKLNKLGSNLADGKISPPQRTLLGREPYKHIRFSSSYSSTTLSSTICSLR